MPYNSASREQPLSIHKEADNEINKYLVDAGYLTHLVYQLTFRQGLSSHFINPRLDSKQLQKCMIYPYNIEIFLECKSWLAQIWIWQRPRYIWVFDTHEKTTLAYCFTFCQLIFIYFMKVMKPELNQGGSISYSNNYMV